MTEAEKEKLEKHIREEIETLKQDIVSYKAVSKPVSPDNAIGRLTRMEAINSKSINEASLRQAESTLAGLERALKMIDDPDFGLCTQCGEPIPFKRLMIMPGSLRCVACAGGRR